MKLLSLSGGGYRGLITLQALLKLEQKHGALNEHFDIIAGTSAGGIIGASLCAGLSVAEIIEHWKILGTEVFRKRPLRGYTNAKYRIEDLERVVKSIIGNATIKGKANLIVTAFDDVSENAQILKSHDRWHRLSLAEMAIATSAAPTYFAPYQVRDFSFIDGGVFSTNPSREAMTEALMLGANPRDIEHISIGTGVNRMNISVGNWGLFQWVLSGRTPIVRIFMESSSSVAEKTASMIGKYRHYDIDIPAKIAVMDAPEFTEEYIKWGQRLAEKIK